jgi:[ribosomal protein S5]-alanine N-acetyltransferase
LASTEPLPTISLGVDGWAMRAWRASDAPALAKHANNVNVWRWMSDSFPHPYTPEIAKHWVTRGHIEFGGDNWAIAFNDEAVGGCGIVHQQGQFRCTAEVGWWLAQAHWGQGLVTRVAQVLVARALDNPQITRVFAPIHDGNERSMRVARNAGMALEAVQRQSAVKDGHVIDRHMFVRLRNG